MQPLLNRALFLSGPSAKDFFPPSVVHIGRGHVADGFVITAMVVIRDEVLHGSAQLVGAGVDKQVHARFERLVKCMLGKGSIDLCSEWGL